jgi:hypothetical protein
METADLKKNELAQSFAPAMWHNSFSTNWGHRFFVIAMEKNTCFNTYSICEFAGNDTQTKIGHRLGLWAPFVSKLGRARLFRVGLRQSPWMR